MKKKSGKIWALILTITMIMSLFASYPVVGTAATKTNDGSYYEQYAIKGGSVAVEAEKVLLDTSSAVIEVEKEAAGRKHVRIFVSDYDTKPDETTPVTLGFDVTLDQDGRYYLWARYATAPNDSAWFSYGSDISYTQVQFEDTESPTDYEWQRIGYFKGVAGDVMKVRIRLRERYFTLDKFIITRDGSYVPEGNGKLPDPDMIGKPVKLPENRYPIPTITPPPEHPRVYFKASDIPQIKQNMQHPEMKELVDFFNERKEITYTGELGNTEPNYSARGLEAISAKALDYALNGNEEHGYQAISAIKNFAISLLGNDRRYFGHVIRVIGQVYDWCYPLLTQADKEELSCHVQMLSGSLEIGFPPDGLTLISGHGAECQLYRDWFTFAIACYDEYPDVYNMVAGKIFAEDSVAFRNWWNQSGTHPQGSSYPLQVRYVVELQAHLLIKRMCGAQLFNEDDLVKIAYEWIYRRRPDGVLMYDGDDNLANTSVRETYAKDASDVMFLASAISGDPILKREFIYTDGLVPNTNSTIVTPTEKIILSNMSIDTNTATGTLPLTRYFASPVGEMVARTGWDMGVGSDDVVATMTIGEYYGMNHAHYDSGSFMIYYKGALANDSGWYEKHGTAHHRNYNSQTVAHNSLLIGTPYNKYGNQNQGIDGQGTDSILSSGLDTNFYWLDNTWKEYQANKQNHLADVIGHEFGPDVQYPQYSYIAGDIADAYTSKYDDGVQEALRHMIFLPTGDEKNPAAFVVFDKIQTKVGGNKKSFLLHMEEEPEVKGNVTTVKRTEYHYNGKLVNQTLLPDASNLKIEKIGGVEYDESGKMIAETDKRYWNRDQNWPTLDDMGLATGSDGQRTIKKDNSLEAGWGRVEISPKKTDKVDYLLNVMYVGQADDNSEVQKAELIETDTFAGAKIFDRVVMFNKNKARTKDAVSFTVPGDESTLKVNVAGLEAGAWNISVNGNTIDTQISSKDGGIIYFTAPAGEYSLTYASEDANKQFKDSGAPKLEGVTILLNNKFLYSDVAPTVIDGRTLIPMRALLEAIYAEVTWDEQTATATAVSDSGIEIKITENQKTAYVNGEPVELDVPAMIINGRFVIPVRFVAENLGANAVVWNDSAKRVEIAYELGQRALEIENVIKVVKASDTNPSPKTDETPPIQSCDGKYSTYWSLESTEGFDASVTYQFDSVKTLDKILISFTQGDRRKAKFDIEVSEDGVNYKTILKDVESSGVHPVGTLEKFDVKGVRAQYVRYKGYGNSVNKWNSVTEIIFVEKK